MKVIYASLIWLDLGSNLGLASFTMPAAANLTAPGRTASPRLMAVAPYKPRRFQWKLALRESLEFLAIEHGDRLLQHVTRMQLRGPFFRDWGNSVRNIRGWGDGDPIITNYIAHPMQGAVSGYIQIQNDPRDQTVEFGRSKKYWFSRLKALAWAAGYSTEFEIGPMSEASIGNVGLTKGTAGFVDLVMTPAGGLGMMVLEDALNRFVLTKIEARTTSRWKLSVYRILLNPSRSFAGVLAGRFPWQQRLDTRTQSDSKRFRGERNSPGKEIEGWDQMGLPLTLRSQNRQQREFGDAAPAGRSVFPSASWIAPWQERSLFAALNSSRDHRDRDKFPNSSERR
jgi:hypothetical protein